MPLAYSKGMVTSRLTERACCDNVLFMALTADAKPRFTIPILPSLSKVDFPKADAHERQQRVDSGNCHISESHAIRTTLA